MWYQDILRLMGVLEGTNYQNTQSENAAGEGLKKNLKGGKLKLALSFLGVVILIAASVGGAIYLVKQKPEILGLSKNSAQESKVEIDKYIEEVGKLILLPNETPTLATVTDLEKVKDQEFFKNAKGGDKVLIYTNAKKAYLYRPSEKRIIEVGIVNMSTTQEENSEKIEVELLPSISPSPSPAVSNTPSLAPTALPILATSTPRPTTAVSPTPAI